MWINREEALKFPFANGQYDRKNADKNFIHGCESYREYLESLPMRYEPPKMRGDWIYSKSECRYLCSSCGEWAIPLYDMETEEHVDDYLSDFCPHCGANMKSHFVQAVIDRRKMIMFLVKNMGG